MFKIGRTTILGLFAAALLSGLTGCGADRTEEAEIIHLSLWSDERSAVLIEEGIADFNREYADQVRIEYTLSFEGEDTCKEMVLADPENAADIYSFADDQFEELWRSGALLENTYDADAVIEAVGGKETAAAQVVTRDGKVYAYPETAGNGYFLYYHKGYFTEEDVTALDRILEIAARKNRKFTMDFSSGWYLYSFFRGAGLTLECSEDGSSNICNWNATDTKYTGMDVAEALLAIAGHEGFISLGDDEFVEGVQDGTIIAGVNGPWNAEYVKQAWGEDYGAVKLPTYTLAGEQVQMYSFSGFKLIGVNAYTEYPQWCRMLASYLTNEENQLRRFAATGECPVNLQAAGAEEVQRAPAVAALAEQSAYSTVQSVADPFWDASSLFGITIAGRNQGKRDLQTLLDEMVEQIMMPSAPEE